MPYQIINDPYRSFSGSLGSSFGTGLSSGIAQLAEHKLAEVLQRKNEERQRAEQERVQQQEAQAYESFGIPQPIAQSIARLAPDQKKTLLENLGSLGGFQPGNQMQLSPEAEPMQPQQIPGLGQLGQGFGSAEQESFNPFIPRATRIKEKESAAKLRNLEKAEERKNAELGLKQANLESLDKYRTAQIGVKDQDLAIKRGLLGVKQEDLKLKRAGEIERQKIVSEKNRVDEEISRAQLALTKEKNEAQRSKIEAQIQQLSKKSSQLASQDDKLSIKNQEQRRKDQAEINRNEKFYNQRLIKRNNALNEIVDKGGNMLKLLANGQVNSGIQGKFQPLWVSNKDSNLFNTDSNSIASLLTDLSEKGTGGIQTVKYNENRKPNLSMPREAQIAATLEMLEEASKGVLEIDIANYLKEVNENEIPKGWSTSVAKATNAIGKPPLRGPKDKDGDKYNDTKNGVQWVVAGPIMRFNGFIEKGK